MKNYKHEDLVYYECASDAEKFDFDNISPKFRILETDQESVCGLDNRTKVTGTRALPFKAICKLYIKARNGRNFIGTGWLTHANKLYTAGHCVYDEDEGGWAQSIIVVPGLSGHMEPYGRYTSSHLVTTQAWINEGSRRYDMGAIKISGTVSHNDFITPMLRNADAADVCGYPGDREQGIFQFHMAGNVLHANGVFRYQIDIIWRSEWSPVIGQQQYLYWYTQLWRLR